MAENRVIRNAIRMPDGEVYGPGREDELEAVMTREQLKRFTDDGSLEGDFKASGKTAQAEATETNDAKKK